VRRGTAIVLALVFVLTVGASGCGSGGSTGPKPELVSAGQVSGKFKQETGRPLRRAATEDPAWEQLSYGLNPSRQLLAQYGVFSVYVAKPGHVGALGSLLKDKATKKALQRDADGVYWERDSNSGTWVAYKRYSGNVVLVWFSGSKTQALDTRFERLDRVLAGLSG
jgi:hypothetical protein